MADDQRHILIAGGQFDLRDAAATLEAVHQGTQIGEAMAHGRNQHFALLQLGDEAVALFPEAHQPPCQHSTLCGGCSLQHMNPDVQIARKEAVLREQLQHFGGLAPKEWLPPLSGPVTGYRSKARMADGG